MISKVPVVICLLLAVPFLADGLKCYQCNSNTAQQSDCMDPFVKEGSQEVKDSLKKYLQECPQIDGEAATLCRKVDQYVRGEASVIRTCATKEYKNDCYKTVLEEYNTLSCTCKGEGCNGAPGTAAASLAATVVMALLAAALQ